MVGLLYHPINYKDAWFVFSIYKHPFLHDNCESE